MSQRLGMADGRCFTLHPSSKLLNDYVMYKYGISYEDNYSYRRLLQQKGPELVREIQALQEVGKVSRPNNYVNQCQSCDKPLLKMPHIY
jgi:hypothetical protein